MSTNKSQGVEVGWENRQTKLDRNSYSEKISIIVRERKYKFKKCLCK